MRQALRGATRPGESYGTGLSLPVDYVVDKLLGNDANPGTPVAPWKSLSKVNGISVGAGATITVRIKSGTYSDASDAIKISNNLPSGKHGIGSRLNLVYEPGCILDGVAANAAVPQTAAHDFGANNLDCYIFGNDLIVRDYKEPSAGSPEAIGVFGTAKVTAYQVHALRCDDGFSAHNTSWLTLYDCSAQLCEKGPFIHVQSARVRAYRCDFFNSTNLSTTAPTGSTTDVECYDCKWTSTANINSTPTFQGKFVRCQIGTLDHYIALGTANAGAGAEFIDSFLHARCDGNFRFKLTRCYGKYTQRVQNGGSVENYNCIWSGPTSAGAIIFSNFNPGSSGVVIHHNNIYRTATAAAFNNVDLPNANHLVVAGAQIHGNILAGSAAFDADLVTADSGNTVRVANITADPLIGSANTLNPDDYGYAPGSPAIGAGLAGANIGFAIGEVQAPAQLIGTVPTP